MIDYITQAWEEEDRIYILTTDGLIQFGIKDLSHTRRAEILALLPLMPGALITGFKHDIVEKYLYLSFKKEGYHKEFKLKYSDLAPDLN